MKTTTAIILGVLLTGFFSIGTTSAGIGDYDEADQTDNLYEEVFKVVFDDQKAAMIDSFGHQNACCKIFNSKNQLVYMSRDKDDQRLNELRKRSDLIMHTESSSYYLLSE